MEIRRVHAYAFGPLDGETLELAPGLTVVYGPNESAKSSWHAAIQAVICGRRRGRGRSKEEQEFADLHRPWDRDTWEVGAELVLDDGRRVELRQDLDGRVDCHAIDLALGTEIASEILHDGALDASRWLGLDRATFVATASIGQAQILDVRDRAAALQEHVQRAAATAGADETAAAAIVAIDAYRRDRVGNSAANAVKPLRQAIVAREAGEAARRDASRARTEYESRLVELTALRGEATAAERLVRLHDALQERDAALRLRTRADEAAALDHRFGGVEPDVAGDDRIATQVATALAAWRARPPVPPEVPAAIPPPADPTRVAPLPVAPLPIAASPVAPLPVAPRPMPTSPDAGRIVDDRGAQDPPRSAENGDSVAAGSSDEELFELARRLESPVPALDPALAERVATGRAAVRRARSRRGRGWLLVALAVVALAGAVGLFVAVPSASVAAAVVAGFGLLVGVAGLVGARGGPLARARTRLADAERDATAASSVHNGALARFEAARARCAELGLLADPGVLREHARIRASSERVAQVQAEAEARAEAARREAQAEADAARAQARLETERAHETAERAQQEADRVRREAEQARWDAAARAAHEALAVRERAAALVLDAARACGADEPDAEQAAAILVEWEAARPARAAERDQARREWARRGALLDGRTVADILSEAGEAETRAAKAADGFAEADLALAGELNPERLRSAARDASARAVGAEAALAERAKALPSLAEAEEALSRAEAELARVRELEEILTLTRGFLVEAQDRVHRDIAPVLAGQVRQALPSVTGGRYTDVLVDPSTLAVRVCGPSRRWRQASLLSHGTAEQVYLLLRIALARQLTRSGTRCPLLLDDVTVHADAVRTEQLLELLLGAAQERQIVLFSQQDQVRDWARVRATGDRHALRELTPLPSP